MRIESNMRWMTAIAAAGIALGAGTSGGGCLRAQTASVVAANAGTVAEQPDKYAWLEDIHGEKPMAWVKAENARSAAVLEKSPHYAGLEADALKVLQSPDRLAMPQFRHGIVYNTWHDADHVRGIVRRTSLKDYLTTEPKWETVLDYDALSKEDKQSWVGHGLDCLEPEEELCLVAVSYTHLDVYKRQHTCQSRLRHR